MVELLKTTLWNKEPKEDFLSSMFVTKKLCELTLKQWLQQVWLPNPAFPDLTSMLALTLCLVLGGQRRYSFPDLTLMGPSTPGLLEVGEPKPASPDLTSPMNELKFLTCGAWRQR